MEEEKKQEKLFVTYKGQTVELPPMGRDDYLAAEKLILEQRLNPIDAIRDEMEKLKDFPHLQERLVDRAYADLRKKAKIDRVSRQELMAWLQTVPGALWSIGYMLRKLFPEITETEVEKIFDQVGQKEAEKEKPGE